MPGLQPAQHRARADRRTYGDIRAHRLVGGAQVRPVPDGHHPAAGQHAGEDHRSGAGRPNHCTRVRGQIDAPVAGAETGGRRPERGQYRRWSGHGQDVPRGTGAGPGPARGPHRAGLLPDRAGADQGEGGGAGGGKDVMDGEGVMGGGGVMGGEDDRGGGGDDGGDGRSGVGGGGDRSEPGCRSPRPGGQQQNDQPDGPAPSGPSRPPRAVHGHTVVPGPERTAAPGRVVGTTTAMWTTRERVG